MGDRTLLTQRNDERERRDVEASADTQLEEMAEALRAAEARYLALLSSGAHAVCRLGSITEGVIAGIGWQSLTGQTDAQMHGWGWLDAVHPDDRNSVSNMIRAALVEGVPAECEFRVESRDGEWRTLHSKLVTVSGAQRGTREWIAIHTDVTDRVRAEQERRRAEAFNRRIIESTHDCVKVLDLEGRLIYLNPKGQELLGVCDLTSFLHSSWLDFWEEPWKYMAARALDEARAGRRGTFQGFCRTFDGTPKWWDVAITPIAGVTGNVNELLTISRDITAQKEALDALHDTELKVIEIRNQLAHAGRITMLGTLAAAIAHELNQPLTAIRANVNVAAVVLARPAPDIALVKAALEDIERDDQRLSDIIEHFRTLLKRGPPSRQPCDLHGTIREVVTLLRSEAAKRRIVLDCRLADETPFVSGDHVQLQQVVLNLLINAFDAAADASSIARAATVSTSRNGGTVVVAVEDEGPPVSDEQFARMTRPFYTTKPDGLGLGLSICREILAAHDSELRAERKTGGGMVFSFALHCEAAPPVSV